MLIKSLFNNKEKIPVKYTADGENINPPILIEDAPKETKSFVLIVDDPDAPRGDWVHWIVFNIPPSIREIKENSVPEGAILGINDAKILRYHGPAPPNGVHRYFFKLFALDCVLTLKRGITKKEVLNAIKGHVLAKAELIGTYERKSN